MDVNVLPSINKGSLLYFTFTSLLQVLKHWLSVEDQWEVTSHFRIRFIGETVVLKQCQSFGFLNLKKMNLTTIMSELSNFMESVQALLGDHDFSKSLGQ